MGFQRPWQGGGRPSARGRAGGVGCPGAPHACVRRRFCGRRCGSNTAMYCYKPSCELARDLALCPACFVAWRRRTAEQQAAERTRDAAGSEAGGAGPGSSGKLGVPAAGSARPRPAKRPRAFVPPAGCSAHTPADFSLYCCLRPEALFRLQALVPRPGAAPAAPCAAVRAACGSGAVQAAPGSPRQQPVSAAPGGAASAAVPPEVMAEAGPSPGTELGPQEPPHSAAPLPAPPPAPSPALPPAPPEPTEPACAGPAAGAAGAHPPAVVLSGGVRLSEAWQRYGTLQLSPSPPCHACPDAGQAGSAAAATGAAPHAAGAHGECSASPPAAAAAGPCVCGPAATAAGPGSSLAGPDAGGGRGIAASGTLARPWVEPQTLYAQGPAQLRWGAQAYGAGALPPPQLHVNSRATTGFVQPYTQHPWAHLQAPHPAQGLLPGLIEHSRFPLQLVSPLAIPLPPTQPAPPVLGAYTGWAGGAAAALPQQQVVLLSGDALICCGRLSLEQQQLADLLWWQTACEAATTTAVPPWPAFGGATWPEPLRRLLAMPHACERGPAADAQRRWMSMPGGGLGSSRVGPAPQADSSWPELSWAGHSGVCSSRSFTPPAPGLLGRGGCTALQAQSPTAPAEARTLLAPPPSCGRKAQAAQQAALPEPGFSGAFRPLKPESRMLGQAPMLGLHGQAEFESAAEAAALSAPTGMAPFSAPTAAAPSAADEASGPGASCATAQPLLRPRSGPDAALDPALEPTPPREVPSDGPAEPLPTLPAWSAPPAPPPAQPPTGLEPPPPAACGASAREEPASAADALPPPPAAWLPRCWPDEPGGLLAVAGPQMASLAWAVRVALPGRHAAAELRLPPTPPPVLPPRSARDWLDACAEGEAVPGWGGALVRHAPHLSKPGEVGANSTAPCAPPARLVHPSLLPAARSCLAGRSR
jgi:hypothetical protein